MSSADIRVYSEYARKREHDGVPCTYGGFGIAVRFIDGRWTVLIKRRNEKGTYPRQGDLPGGGVHIGPEGDAFDPDDEAASKREVLEEVLARSRILAAFPPLYLPIKKDGVLVKVDRARAFLIDLLDKPQESEEALELKWVDQLSFDDPEFPVVSRVADPSQQKFGRTPVMIYDGLSVMQKPLWVGRLNREVRSSIIGDPNGPDFVLADGGAYLAKTFLVRDKWRHKVRYIALYRRLNPDQPNGYFPGAFDYLAT